MEKNNKNIRRFILLILSLLLLNASISFGEQIIEEKYGLSKENPIKVGGLAKGGPQSERAYLKMLCGPNNEEIRYQRSGSCCHFKTPNSPFGGLLDMYTINHEGIDEPIIIYLNSYDISEENIVAPFGLKLKNDKK